MKRILFVSLVLFVVVIMVSSCFKLTVDSVTTDELKVVLSSGDLVISTRSAFSGIEISLVGEILQEDVLCGDGMICVVTSRQGRSYVAVVKPGQEFATGERVLTISGDYVSLKGLGITSQSASIPESHKPSATEPLNDGISVIDGIVFKESEGSFFIRGKNISNIGGTKLY